MLPSVFISHGSPMHALQPGAAGEAWKALARRLPRPKAIVIASAHWETNLPMLTGSDKPHTIHDFTNFPEPLYRLRYPAPGAPEVLPDASHGARLERVHRRAVRQEQRRQRPRRISLPVSRSAQHPRYDQRSRRTLLLRRASHGNIMPNSKLH